MVSAPNHFRLLDLARDRLVQDAQQLGALRGFDDVMAQAGLLHPIEAGVQLIGGEHQDRRRRSFRSRSAFNSSTPPTSGILLSTIRIENRCPDAEPRCDRRNRFGCDEAQVSAMPPKRADHLREHREARGIVVDNQDPAPVEVGVFGNACDDFGWERERHRRAETAALENLALDRQFAAQQSEQAIDDRQAQPAALMPPRGRRIELGEDLENRIDLFLGNPDAGIADGEADLRAIVAFRGELSRPPARLRRTR